MKVLYGKRRSGKTTELIVESSLKENSQIVVSGTVSKTEIINRAKELGIKIKHPITFRAILEGRFNGEAKTKLFIDDLDCCLSSLFPNIEMATLSDEDRARLDCLYETIAGLSNGIYFKKIEKVHGKIGEACYYLLTYSNGQGTKQRFKYSRALALLEYEKILINIGGV